MKLLFKLLAKTVALALGLTVVGGLGLGYYAMTLLPQLPTMEEIRRVPLDIPLRIYNRDNQLIAEYGNERRIPVSLDEMPPLLIDAVLATEDDRFYHHAGVDFPGIARAALRNLRSQARVQGASTVTMQVARNFFLTPERTYQRKLKEMLLALKMERALTKDEILELYFNKIFLGHRAYGFAAAAQVYYGVELHELSIPEIAMLAGLPRAPSRDNPISNPEKAAERRAHVLKRLHELGRIDDFSYNAARAAPVTATRHAEQQAQAPYPAEMARAFMLQRFGERAYSHGYSVTLTVDGEHQAEADAALRAGLLAYDKRHGYRGPLANLQLDDAAEKLDAVLREYPASRELQPAVVLAAGERSAEIYTQDGETARIEWEGIEWARAYQTPNSLGPEPAAADEVLMRGDLIYAARDGDEWRLSQLPAVSGALVSLDANSGAILSLTGGFDYYLSKFNRATQAKRQPGSNIKPFIYSAALDNGFTAGSLVSAVPVVNEDDFGHVWRPQNYSNKFFGPTRLREALSRSLNLVSVRLMRAMGMEKTRAHLAKFGFSAEEMPRSLSLALGSMEVAPVEMAAAFAVFANGGMRVRPYLIEEILDRDGNEIALPAALCEYCRAPPGAAEGEETAAFLTAAADTPVLTASGLPAEPQWQPGRVISPQNAFITSHLLQQVIRSGTGSLALSLNRGDLAGKTGTTNDFRDAWFSGFTRDVVTTVFVGFDEPSHLGRRESGATAALPIWVDYMGEVLPDFPEKQLTPPANITTRFISKNNGRLTSPEDPDGYHEYFIAGTEPNNRVTPLAAARPAAVAPATPVTGGADAAAAAAGAVQTETDSLF